MITPSQGVITYCDYNSWEDELTLNTSTNYDAPTAKDSAVFYWKPFVENTKYIPKDVVIMNPLIARHKGYLLFVGLVEVSALKGSKVVGHYDKSKFPADFDGPLVGVGQACYEDKDEYGPRGIEVLMEQFKVHVPHGGKIYEVYKFSFLCSKKLPDLQPITFPDLNWVQVSDNHLPSNIVAGGVASNGETLYIGRREHNPDESSQSLVVPGYVTPSSKALHICWNCAEHCYSGLDSYEVLVTEQPEIFEWGVYSGGEVPRNAVVAGIDTSKDVYIGRTVTGSDISTGKTWQGIPIKLPPGRVANMQLVGKVFPGHKCLYVPWGGKEYIYPTYEVLMMKISPNSLQHLSRKVIVTATMGMSDRVDQLNLPAHMKYSCKVADI